jgi:DNA-binding NtrC family response regulator
MNQRILAVDDEGDMLRLMDRIIRGKTDYQFETCNNPMDVPSLLEQERYDLIISDLKMPGMDGLDILRWLKEHDRRELTIIITAYGSFDTALEAIQQGAFNFIIKPFKKDYLLEAVHRAMEHQAARGQAQQYRELMAERPFGAALERFKREYILHALRSNGTDPSELARETGVDEGWIRGMVDGE